MATSKDSLDRYRAKRDFDQKPEPKAERVASGESLSFVIQKHAATRLHYDFRLELDGAMLSWAVPKGPSFDPTDKRMAVRTEDHPISYSSFEGTIPPKQYGAGTVIVWDNGTWVPTGDPHDGLAKGKLLFTLHGKKLQGLWELVRIGKPDDKQEQWILFKKHDKFERAKSEYDVVMALPDSVIAKPIQRGTAPPDSAPSPLRLPPNRAAKAKRPDTLAPQLATVATDIPVVGSWSYEIKFDGYRVMARIEKSKPTLITRGGHDWTSKMPQLAAELASFQLEGTWLDGELVVLDDDGVPSFNALQNSFDKSKTDAIVYFVFDAPFFKGADLRELPLSDRRALLKQFFDAKATNHVRFSADFPGDPATILESACKMNLEGLIAKRTDAPYQSKRTETWLKLKCHQRQEFVIGGFTDRSNAAHELGSLLLGIHDEAGQLIYAGRVGTGWNSKTGVELKAQLEALEMPTSPFAPGTDLKKGRWSKRSEGNERWLKPDLLAEVTFAEWTPDGQVRHASFQGLRTDKPARAIQREVAMGHAGARSATASSATGQPVAGTRVSNPARVIDKSTGITKLELIRYYESVADRMVPHLKGRPCSFVRGPSGIEGELFFQKHAEKLGIADVKDLDPALWPGHPALLEVPTAKALIGAAQMNVIEFHTWNAMAKNIGKPDRMIFDLDPGEGVAWAQIQDAAVLTRSLLSELGLTSWLKTSGGKGLHVVVPLTPRYDWDTINGFSKAVVQHLARVIPDRFVAKSGGANRIGKIFVDYLRNGHGATTAAAFSARSRPGLGVSIPIAWEALPSVKGGAQWTIRTARDYLSFETEDPWADYWAAKQSITAGMKTLGFVPSAKISRN